MRRITRDVMKGLCGQQISGHKMESGAAPVPLANVPSAMPAWGKPLRAHTPVRQIQAVFPLHRVNKRVSHMRKMREMRRISSRLITRTGGDLTTLPHSCCKVGDVSTEDCPDPCVAVLAVHVQHHDAMSS